jgi:hypothetical protein
MQVVSYFSAMYKKFIIFRSGRFVQPPTRSLDSPYTKHGTPHFHTEHCPIGYLMSTLTLDSHWLH